MIRCIYNSFSGAPSIALSGENNISPGLFMAFTQHNNNYGYFMTSKTIPWTQNSFRPDQETAIAGTDQKSGIQVYPNPFTQGFQLKKANNKEDIYRLQLTDITGRHALSLTGNIISLNIRLAKANLNILTPGNYYLSLENLQDNQIDHFYLVKIK